MIKNQLMKREFLGSQISQRTDNSFFNATELLQIYNLNTGNKKRFKDFWENNATKEFLQALVNELNTNGRNSAHLENSIKSIVLEQDLFITKRGKNGATYMHPYLFIEFAAWLNAEFRVKLYKWIYDNLILFRNECGDHYKEMCHAIQIRYEQYYEKKPDMLIFAKEARYLNELVFGDGRSRQRNEANEIQLKTMNALQLANIKLINKGVGKSDRMIKLRDFKELM